MWGGWVNVFFVSKDWVFVCQVWHASACVCVGFE